MFELNVHAPVDLAQQVIPSMRERGRGWIVNISSATSRHPKGPPFDPGIKLGSTSTLYGATKAALERITTGLAAEVYDDGIAVNSLAPVAAVRTPGAEVHLGPLLDERPEIVEPVELLADAALVLATCDPATVTGRVVYSRPFLRELGRPTDR
jgi:NAD(P)-dependent dehydrogenase (short-subunit alcohol dehydrogenase family)